MVFSLQFKHKGPMKLSSKGMGQRERGTGEAPTILDPEKRHCCAEQSDQQEGLKQVTLQDTRTHECTARRAQCPGHPGHAGLSGVLGEVLAKGAFAYLVAIQSSIFPFSSSSSQCV